MMRNRKSKKDSENNKVLNGAAANTSPKTKIRNKNNQQMLRYVLLGFVGLIFAFGILVFVMVDLNPFSDADLYGRTKTKASDNAKVKKSDSKSSQNDVRQQQTDEINKASEQNLEEDKATAEANVHKVDDKKIQDGIVDRWREADGTVLEKYGSVICNIEKRKAKDLSTKEFESLYRFKKPVIVQFANGAADWTEPEKWTVPSLKVEYGNYMIFSGNAREIVRRGGNGEVGSTFSEFVDKLITRKDETGEPLYVFDRNFYNTSSLPKTLKPPEYFKIQDGVDDSIFFLGASKSGVSFHKHADSWNGVLFGRKRWFIYPIEHTPPGGVFTGYTMLEWYNTIYPKLKANTDKPLECIQEAGEILYLPEGFYHGTINLGDTVAIGIQKKESELEIQKLFYEDRYLYQMLEKSKSYEEREEWTQKIIDLYTKILKLLPDNTEVMNHLAELYPHLGRHRESMTLVDKVLKKDQYFLIAMLVKADLLIDLNKPLEAEEILQEALLLNPELFDTRLRYGNLLYNTGRPEEAVFHFKKATELRPGDITFWNHLKNAQIASGDDEGADDTDQIISYIQNYYQ